ncbi:MAG TPA: hypothetical protein VFI17_03490 [Solirubrobacterales bacterium]|nr:hypothetical protein [Solirubrobacterales bacterium]
MATGRATGRGGGVLSEADVRGGGEMEWGNLIGIHPDHPLVAGSGPGSYSGAIVNENSRIVTTPAGLAGPAGGVIATPEGVSLRHLDDWRDVFNFKGSPAPWLLLVILGVVFFAHASVRARAGAFGKSASARAAFG